MSIANEINEILKYMKGEKKRIGLVMVAKLSGIPYPTLYRVLRAKGNFNMRTIIQMERYIKGGTKHGRKVSEGDKG